MTKIWHIIGAKENESLSTEEMQKMILKELFQMRKDIEYMTKAGHINAVRSAIKQALDSMDQQNEIIIT